MNHAEVIGDPIAHSRSPQIHMFWLERLGLAGSYGATHVEAAALPAFLAERRADPLWRGCNVTLPHKQRIMPLLDAVDAKARAIGAVNTVVADAGRLLGTNTDVDGVGAALAGCTLAGRRAVVIGAGGAARAAFAWLASSGAAVQVLARDPAKARATAADCGLDAGAHPLAPDSAALDGAALLINATQLGMTGQAEMPDLELARLAPDALVFDMVYAPLETALLRAARAQGFATADGLTMLIGQAATAFERFFGVAPDRKDDPALRELLTP